MKIVASHFAPGAQKVDRVVVPPPKKPYFPPNVPNTPGVGAPISFYDSAVVKANGEQAFKSRAFENTTKQHVEIHAMSVSVQMPLGAGPEGGPYVLGTAAIGLQIAVGKANVPMTRGFVPAWMLAPSDNRRNETTITYLGTTQTVVKFASPIHLAPGEQITVQAKHFGYVRGNATVHVAFAGRRRPSAPGLRRVPYIFHWAGTPFAYASASSISAPPAALANDTKRPLTIERIIGRFASFEALGGIATQPSLNDFGDQSNQMATTLVRLGISTTKPILNREAPWLAVFGVNAALETDFVMSPGDYLSATVKHAAGPTLATASPFFRGQPFISVVGSREV